MYFFVAYEGMLEYDRCLLRQIRSADVVLAGKLQIDFLRSEGGVRVGTLFVLYLFPVIL